MYSVSIFIVPSYSREMCGEKKKKKEKTEREMCHSRYRLLERGDLSEQPLNL